MERQLLDWQPVVDWFCQRHNISIKPSTNMTETPIISNEDREIIRRQLLSYSFNAVQGFTFGVDALKSLILMSAIVEHKLSVEHAVQLTRLETQFQVRKLMFMSERGKIYIKSRVMWSLWDLAFLIALTEWKQLPMVFYSVLYYCKLDLWLQWHVIVLTFSGFHCTHNSKQVKNPILCCIYRFFS